MKDNIAIACSGLCLLHCLLTPILLLLGLMGSLTSWLDSPWIHWVLLVPVIVLALLSLPFSFLEHGRYLPMCLAVIGIAAMVSSFFVPERYEFWITIPSAWLIIWAHLWNKWLLVKQQLGMEPAHG